VKLALLVSAAPQLLAKISRVIPPASAAIHAPVSSARSVVDATAAAVDDPTVVVAVQIAAQTAAARAARDSNAVPAALAVPGTIAVTAAIPVRRADRN
jgi:hypothetical protein